MSTLRNALGTLRNQRFHVRIGGPDATVRGQWLLLLGAMAVVFVCFFAIGRVQTGGSEAPGQTPAALQGSSARSAIPAGLSGESPISGKVPIAIVEASRPALPAVSSRPARRASLSAPAPTRAFAPEPSHEEAPARSESASGTPAGEPESAPAPTTAKAGGGSSGSGGGATHRSKGAGGGSFDSSE